MENEKFQEIMIEHMARMTQELTELKTIVLNTDQKVVRLEDRMGKLEDRMGKLEERVGRLEDRINRMEERLSGVQSDLAEVKTRQEVIMAQVADLSEFRAVTTEALNKIGDQMEFFIARQGNMEIDLYRIKKRIS